MKILVIAAHPDDEILGMGGTIKKFTKNGDVVKIVIKNSILKESIIGQVGFKFLPGFLKKFNGFQCCSCLYFG